MKALITGGGGFLAAHLCPLLVREGFQLRLLLRRKEAPPFLRQLPLEVVNGDLGDPESLKRAAQGMDAVFHMAGVISYNPAKNDLMVKTNVHGTRHMAEAALAAGVRRFVYTSSTAAIGVNTDPKAWMNEATPFNARPLKLAYFDTKYDAELELKKVVAKGLDAVIVNPGSLVGAWDERRYEKSYPGLIYKYNPRFLVHGGINYVDVRDAALGHLLAFQKGRTGERYLLGGENLTYSDFIRRTNAIIGRSSPKFTIPKSLMGAAALGVKGLQLLGIDLHFTPELVRQIADWYLFVDSSKAQQELGYKPRQLDEAIRLTLDWLKAEGRIK